MSKNWYPVINYENCIECGACVEMCQNGVYEKGTTKPNVVNPDGCVEGCRGCQVECPSEAIEYAGDVGNESACGPGCSCNGNC